MHFRGIFFTVTELHPPDPLMGKTSSLSLLCYTLIRMEAVGKKTKTFLKRSILQVYACTHGYVCVLWPACACVCVHISVCALLRVSACVC